MTDSNDKVVHEPEQQRYVVHFDNGGQGELVYRRENDTLHLVHSEVPANRRGEGLGARLMSGALGQIEAEQLKVVPVCRYTKHYIARNARWQTLLA